MGKKWRWGVIIDAGSSGSRLHVYRWKDPSRAIKGASKEEHRLPKIKSKWTKKIRPGISTFGSKPTAVGADHLQELIDYALDVIPEHMVADTPIFLMATAGMRLLPQAQQMAVLDQTCSYLRHHTNFSLPDCDQSIQVISGETEGLYGWLAANYLLGGFDQPEEHDHGQNHNTYGFLDMGGASAQIAFAPNATEAAEHADQLKLVRLRTLDGLPAEHRVFTATWLGFGVNKAREAYVEALADHYSKVLATTGEIPDPCMPKGLQTALDGTILENRHRKTSSAGQPRLVGTGDFASCLVETKPLLSKDTACGGQHQPCLIHDSVPSIDFNINHFVGVSEYYHSTHGFFGEKDGDQAYDFNAYQRKVLQFCNQDWTSIHGEILDDDLESTSTFRKHKNVDRTIQDAQEACFKASWVLNVLHEGIGIPRVGLEKLPGLNVSNEALAEAKKEGYITPFRPVDTIDSVEVSWTLGRMLLYASGQVPPRSSSGSSNSNSEVLAVGFGSNVEHGTPADFTYAGSTWTPLNVGSGDSKDGGKDDADWGDTAEDMLDKARETSTVPSAIFFLVVLLVFVFLLRRRERRLRLFNKFGAVLWRSRWPGSPRKTGRFGHGSFPGGGGGGGSGGGGGALSGLAKRLFGRHSRDYERVLEEGQLDQFELGDVDSHPSLDDSDFTDSSEGGSSRRLHAHATPTLSFDKFEDLRPSSSSSSVTPAAAGVAATTTGGNAISAMDRSGLAVRTESRERLGGPSLQMLNAGRRSRAASPTRLKSPMFPPVQEG